MKLFPKVGRQQREFALNTDAVHKIRKGAGVGTEGAPAAGRNVEKRKRKQKGEAEQRTAGKDVKRKGQFEAVP